MNRSRYNPKRNFHKRFAHAAKPDEKLIKKIQEIQTIRKSESTEIKTQYISKNSFEDFPVLEQLKKNIRQRNYTTPTEIQDQSIPEILKGRDIIGIANTGTGKTAAFLIPLVDKVAKNKSERVLILAPTRELAVQIQQELRFFTEGLGIYATLCIGGTNMHRQKNELRQLPHFVIGTPGRIKDLIKDRALFLSMFHTVVLDEADRMVDIGFINDIKYFISLLPQQRHSLFFSATISGKVREILQAFVKNPITISLQKQDTAETIQQAIIKVINKNTKLDQLHNLLAQEGFDKVLIFGKTKWGVQKLTEELIRRGFRAGAIHGNKRQNQRQKTLEQFKRNEITILLATDVASRGLDIQDVSHVINYDMPASYEDYIHRIGRTGRASKTGIALTFVE